MMFSTSNETNSLTSIEEAAVREIEENPQSQSEGNEIDDFILKLLHGNERLTILKLDNELDKFIKDPNATKLEFPPMSSYQRLIVHRVAQYFKLDHPSIDLGSSKRSVILTKNKDSRTPALRLCDLVEQEEPTPSKSVKILVRRNAEKTPSSGEVSQGDFVPKILSSNHSSTAQNKEIMNISNQLEILSLEEQENKLNSKSLEEREAEYQRARARIFKDENPTPPSPSPTPTPIPTSNLPPSPSSASTNNSSVHSASMPLIPTQNVTANNNQNKLIPPTHGSLNTNNNITIINNNPILHITNISQMGNNQTPPPNPVGGDVDKSKLKTKSNTFPNINPNQINIKKVANGDPNLSRQEYSDQYWYNGFGGNNVWGPIPDYDPRKQPSWNDHNHTHNHNSNQNKYVKYNTYNNNNPPPPPQPEPHVFLDPHQIPIQDPHIPFSYPNQEHINPHLTYNMPYPPKNMYYENPVNLWPYYNNPYYAHDHPPGNYFYPQGRVNSMPQIRRDYERPPPKSTYLFDPNSPNSRPEYPKNDINRYGKNNFYSQPKVKPPDHTVHLEKPQPAHILEIKGLTSTSPDDQILQPLKDAGANVKFLEDNTCLAIFKTSALAKQILASFNSPHFTLSPWAK